tara:strand:- start:12042 stop:12362 length:321 start_codon:yes stop_codon:yes gene_type:complete
MNFQSGKYPHAPGHRGIDTSMEAAEKIAPKLGKLQALTFHAICLAGSDGLTAHELYAQLGMSNDSIQPRISELQSLGKIKDSGQRRRNASGVNAKVWIINDDNASE